MRTKIIERTAPVKPKWLPQPGDLFCAYRTDLRFCEQPFVGKVFVAGAFDLFDHTVRATDLGDGTVHGLHVGKHEFTKLEPKGGVLELERVDA